MACFESGTVISLPAREAITLPHVGGATLRVTQGVLWLTEENERNDIVLRRGDNWLVESNGDTVVEAQNDAVFCVVGRKGVLLALPARVKRAPGILANFAASLLAPPRQLPYL
jgi:Protein of unknown function (DUF2917)